ncbi:unnamed protein product [Protopolystoma xenopodis]|uniref:Nucleoporin Nup133/Nup155-like N-terminal domain-containing protein n=1 Tax=Protopolystoma xenopodis TaxID=117903 RepID=A0A448XJ39_9PLAT|nr:unnamed protein product [Protopolystoma xenopodis]
MAVISGDEESCGAIIWRCDTGSRLQTLQPPGVSVDSPVVDVCAVSLNPGSESPEHHLALLTERQVYLYSWRRTGT